MSSIYGSKYTQEDWDKLEKEFLAGFYKYFEELNGSIELLRKNKNNPFIRSQVCLVFIAIDSFSRFHEIFQGKRDMQELNGNNEKRFKNWLNEFVFTEENDYYQKHKGKIKCDAGVAWKLRNSFVHFYSFPDINSRQNFVGFSFNIPSDRCRKMSADLKKKTGKSIVFIDIYHLIRAIFDGITLQLKYFAKMVDEDPEEYFSSVIFAHKIIKQTGTSTIKM